MIREGTRPSPPRVRADWTRLPDGKGGCDQSRIDLALVAVEVDLGARRPGDEGGGARGRRPPDQAVDKPVLQRLQRRLGQARGAQQLGPVVAPGMRHRQDHRRNRPLGPDPEEGQIGGGASHSSPGLGPEWDGCNRGRAGRLENRGRIAHKAARGAGRGVARERRC